MKLNERKHQNLKDKIADNKQSTPNFVPAVCQAVNKQKQKQTKNFDSSGLSVEGTLIPEFTGTPLTKERSGRLEVSQKGKKERKKAFFNSSETCFP